VWGKTWGSWDSGDWTSGGATRERFSDEGGLHRRGARSRGRGEKLKAEFREMNAFTRGVDFISLHVPLLGTRRLFDARTFAQMKRRQFLINTSRGR